MIKYATRLPPGKPVQLLDNGLIRKTCKGYSATTLEFMETLVNHFIMNPDPLVVPVSNFINYHGSPGYEKYSYSYDMMRCGILSSEERDYIDIVGDLHDSYNTEAFNDEVIYSEDGLELISLNKKFPRLYEFLSIIVKQGRYWDIHSGNIMMNEDYQYCLIDLESFKRN